MTAYYIDPSASINGNGTEASPFNTWKPSLWAGHVAAAGNQYLQKKGTTWNSNSSLAQTDRNISWGWSGVAGNPVILGAYGKDTIPLTNGLAANAPKLVPDDGGTITQGITFSTNTHHVIVQDLEIAGHSGKAIQNGGTTRENDISITIQRCYCRDTNGDFNGIDLRGQNCRILYCKLENIGADAIWLDSNNFEVGYCTIINPSTFGTSGDGIQGSGTSGNVWIHDNYIDHTGVDSKHCIIMSSMTASYSGGIIERNTCLGFVGGAVNKPIYIGSQNLLIRENLFKGGFNCTLSGGTADNASGSILYSNVFDGQVSYNLDIYASITPATNLQIHRNTFIRGSDGLPNVRNSFNSNQADITRNIFIGGTHGLEIRSLDTHSLNCFFGHSGTPIYNAQTATSPALPADSFIGDPLLDENYQPSADSPCIGTGGRAWWSTAARLNGHNNEPIPDEYMDIGAVQTQHSRFHPLNLKRI